MKYSKTALMELSHSYKIILKKCAYLNACFLIGVMIALPVGAKNLTWDGINALEIGEEDTWKSNKNQTVTGTLTGSGIISALPSGSTHENTTLTIESSLSDFTGTFSTTQSGNSGKPNSVSTIIFDTDTSKGINLSGNGNFVFNNDVTLSSVVNNGNIYLKGNELTVSDNSTIGTSKVYLAGGLDDNTGKTVSLTKYDLSSVKASVAGTGITNGHLTANISDSVFAEIAGSFNNASINGDVNLNLKNVTSNIYGQRITDTTDIYPANADISGDINIVGDYVNAGTIVGQDFSAVGAITSGVNGNVNITLTNSTVGNLRGSNTTAPADSKQASDWISQYFKAAEKTTLSIEDTLVKEELIAVGGYASANNVVINVKGDSVIGYTDKTATTKVGDGWIIAGANRFAGTVGSTEVNLNTDGAIKIAGDVNIGSRDRNGDLLEPAEGSVKGNATLNMLGGGTIDVGGALRAYHVAGTTTLNINNVTANVASVAGEFDVINLDENATLNVKGDLTIKENASLNAKLISPDLHSSILADTLTFAGNNTLNLTIANGLANADYDFITATLNAQENLTIADNLLYNLELTDNGKISVSKKSTETIVEALNSEGATRQEAATILAISNSNSDNRILVAISEAAQTGDIKIASQAAKELAPTTSQQVMSVAQSVNTLLSNVAGNRLAGIGRSGGDTFVGGSVWAQSLYNHTKQDATASASGFTADTKGVAFGIDGKLNEAVSIGIGYSYNQTEADADGRDVDVDGHNFFAYAQYQPDAWYINGMLNYGFSQYTEKKAPLGIAMKAKYDVNTYAANVMTGYNFKTGITPEAGLRYVLADQETYNDGAQRISTDHNNVLTAVIGVKYSKVLKANDWTFKPSIRLATTYDLISDNSEANINVIGGGHYQITGQRLDRFGIETGVGLTGSIKNWDLTLEYNGGFREDFQTHTGMLKAKYNF